MSGFVPYVFTDQQLVDIRRFCGFPTRSNGAVLFPAPWVNIQYLALEYRLANISSDEAGVVITTYLANLYTLESAIPGAGANLSTDQAAVWTHNKNEVRDRMADAIAMHFAANRRGGPAQCRRDLAKRPPCRQTT